MILQVYKLTTKNNHKMRDLTTKESRLNSQNVQFDSLLKNGYSKEVYKGLHIFTLNEGTKYLLKIFRNTASNHICFYAYRTEEQMNEAIERYKGNEDRNIAYKAECKANPKKSTAANTAAAIRKELKDKFPQIKFTVTSDNFANGNSVRIGWIDGPSSAMVEEITGKYQYGHFDGMTDMYENTNSREDIPQAKYVSTNRTRSEEATAQIVAKLGYTDADDWKRNGPMNQEIYIEFCKMDLTPKAEVKETKEAVNYEPVEVKAGEINIIDYSEKAIAVIGDTKPIKDKLKELGGRFNFRLTCGPGWIFPKTKLEDIKAALKGINEDIKKPLNEEIQKTIEFFKEADVKIYGEVTPQVKEIEQMYKEPEVKHYDNLKDIEEAANSGTIISLCNLSELVNRKQA